MRKKTLGRKQISGRIRDVARVWSIIVFILALILLVGTRFVPSNNDPANRSLDILVPFFLLISLAGLGIAWRWEGLGILINLGFYLAIMPLYWLLHQEWVDISVMVGLSPVILPGVLYAVAWLLSKE